MATLPEDSLSTNQMLAKFFVVEEPSVYAPAFTPSEQRVEAHYKKTHTYLPEQKRYLVRLPKKEDEAILGESKTQAINRAKANERSLIRNQAWPKFQEVMQEYLDLGHAKPIPFNDAQPLSNCYYMPVHAVYKESSSTTKIRAVFDASARSTNHTSLNDLLAVGPTLHPTLDQILLRFRTYAVAISGDITKMYREVLLHPDDQSLHRFIWRANTTDEWKAFQMTRVTFGVAASPYLAVKTLQQAAQDFGNDTVTAQWHLQQSFYVDDLMGGADTVEEAISLYHDLRAILSKASFQLKKWRSSSPQVLKTIPIELQEALPLQDLVDMHAASYPKALGVTWDSRQDTMATHINLPATYASTKRGIISDIARTFDVLGWLSPVIFPMKIMYRELWKTKLNWDEEVSTHLKKKHARWREELYLLATVRLPRHYYHKKKPLTVELHGYCDASMEAYAAVVYVRATYTAGPPSSHLVVSKTRVAPLKTRSIPQLELCGANLLATLLTTTRQTLNVPLHDVHAYCDSTIVLAWLDGSPQRYKIFIANRIASTVNLIPTSAWRHVPTKENPADAASRGLTASELKDHPLWWHGPPWLLQQPVKMPPQPSTSTLIKLQQEEAKPQICNITAVTAAECMEDQFNSYHKLLKVICWIRRLAWCMRNKHRRPQHYFSTQEAREATQLLLHRSQLRSFSKELKQLKANPPKDISQSSPILKLRPRVDDHGTLRVGGRLSNANIPEYEKHPTILSSRDHFTNLLFRYYHLQLGHCGPTALLSHASYIYHVVGARRLSRDICQKCVTCRAAAAKVSTQLIGQLPPERVDPDFTLAWTWLGHLLSRRGILGSQWKSRHS